MSTNNTRRRGPKFSADAKRIRFLSERAATGGRYRALLDAGVSTFVIESAGAEAGAIGSNRNGWDSARPQADLWWHLVSAVDYESAAAASLFTDTELAVGYTFAHQTDSGTFSNTLGLGELTAAEGTTFCMAHMMRVFLLSQDFPDNIDLSSYASRLRRVMDWLIRGDVAVSILSLSGSTANRPWHAAVALGLGSNLFNIEEYYRSARAHATVALNRQHNDGAFWEPDSTGKDGGYQSVSIHLMQQFVAWWPRWGNTADLATVTASLSAAVAWLVTQINATTGQIADGDRTTGTDIQYHIAAMALWNEYERTRDEQYLTLGNLVYDHGQSLGLF